VLNCRPYRGYAILWCKTLFLAAATVIIGLMIVDVFVRCFSAETWLDKCDEFQLQLSVVDTNY